MKMEIHRWHCYLVINVAVVVSYLEAKPVSLNKIIAAEEQQSKDLENLSTTIEDTTERRFSLNQDFTAPSVVTSRKSKGPQNIPLDKKVPLLKYRKTYEIKSPLKPNKLKRTLNPRYKRKNNKSIKREIHEYEKFNHRYIPLLKSVGMLFDNLLDTASSETYETRSQYGRNRDYTGERKRVVCSCALRSESDLKGTDSNEKTITFTSTITPEVSTVPENSTLSETTTAPTNHSATSHVSGLRQNKDLPVLLPRNTFGFRRNNLGHSKGSGAAYNGDIEGNIARDHGDGEHFTSNGENGSDTESYEENSRGYPRDDARSDGSRDRESGDGNIPAHTRHENSTDENEDFSEGQTAREPIRRHVGFKRENYQQNRGNQTKSSKHISQFIRRLRGSLSKIEIGNISKSLQSEENNEESVNYDTFNHTSPERFPKGGGTDSKDVQKVRSGYEDLNTAKDIKNSGSSVSKSPKRKSPVIMIIDGYSLTRDKNGENKMSEKSIRLHS